ncbi:MAG TPA: hypothetical protein VHE35_32590, partial [Kofleriaceae bacterium]|nr:hypothetical protein [Kofleriaceae bacterium]
MAASYRSGIAAQSEIHRTSSDAHRLRPDGGAGGPATRLAAPRLPTTVDNRRASPCTVRTA